MSKTLDNYGDEAELAAQRCPDEESNFARRRKLQRASVAALVRQRVQMLPLCYLPAQKFRISRSCRKAAPERRRRVLSMVRAMDAEGFGNCTNIYECVAVCPADISGSVMAKMYREYAAAALLEAVGGTSEQRC